MPAVQPTYDTGFFSTPGDLLTQANQVNAQIQAIDDGTNGNNAIPVDWFDSWMGFRAEWLHFFSSTFGGHGFQQGPSGSSASATGAWLTSDLAGQLASYEAQTASWAQQAQQYGIVIPGGIIKPNDDASKVGDLFTGIEAIVVLLIVLLLVSKA